MFCESMEHLSISAWEYTPMTPIQAYTYACMYGEWETEGWCEEACVIVLPSGHTMQASRDEDGIFLSIPKR